VPHAKRATYIAPVFNASHPDHGRPISHSNALGAVTLVAVGSTNRVKVAAVRAVLGAQAPGARVESVEVPSGVRDQPFGDEETIRGALARARGARVAVGADIGVGIEGGVVEGSDGSMRTCAWAAVVTADGREGVGGSLAMPLPGAVAAEIRAGRELGHAMDRLVGEHDTKRGAGAVGILTRGLIDRQRAYEVLVTYALAPLLTPELYARD
jgi:inosine/xanthosine triphosphatase